MVGNKRLVLGLVMFNILMNDLEKVHSVQMAFLKGKGHEQKNHQLCIGKNVEALVEAFRRK